VAHQRRSKRKQGQQPKWDAWVRKMDEVINREHPVGYAVIYNDTMLLEMVNAELPEDERITIRTFTNYKQEGHVQDGSIASLFVSTYKRALSIQADNIFRRMVDEGPGSWQKWAWIWSGSLTSGIYVRVLLMRLQTLGVWCFVRRVVQMTVKEGA